MKEDIATSVFNEAEYLYDELWRHQVFREYSIVHNVRIDAKEAFNWRNFVAFIFNGISNTNIKNPIPDPFEGLITHSETLLEASITSEESE